MPFTDPRAIVIKQNAINDETQRLNQLNAANNQMIVNDNIASGNVQPNMYQAEEDALLAVATARYNAQVSLLTALNAL